MNLVLFKDTGREGPDANGATHTERELLYIRDTRYQYVLNRTPLPEDLAPGP